MAQSLMFSLSDASVTRRMLREQAKADFERECERAAVKCSQRVRAADRSWEHARRQAKFVAGLRAGVWRQFRQLSDNELALRLLLCQNRLDPDRVVKLTAAARAEQTWYVRMIRNEMIRRDLADVPAVQLERREYDGLVYDEVMAGLEQDKVRRFRAGLGVAG